MVYALFISLLVYFSYTDIKRREIPNNVIIPAIILSFFVVDISLYGAAFALFISSLIRLDQQLFSAFTVT